MPLIKISEATAGRRTVNLFAPGSPGAASAKIKKGNAAAAASAGTLVEPDAANAAGWYAYTFTAGEADTLGPLSVAVYDGGNLVGAVQAEVVQFDPYDTVRGFAGTALPAVAAGANGGVPLVGSQIPNANAAAAGGLFIRGTGAGAINQDANGRIDVNMAAWSGTAVAAVDTAGYPKVTVKSGVGAGEISLAAGIAEVNLVELNGAAVGGSTEIDANVVKVDSTAVTATAGFLEVTLKDSSITAASFDDDAIDADAFAQSAADKVWDTASRTLAGDQAWDLTGDITGDIIGDLLGSVSGSVGSVTGAVGSVTGAVGNVTGAVGSVTAAVLVGSFSVGAITTAAFAANAINAAAVAADVTTEVWAYTKDGLAMWQHNVAQTARGTGPLPDPQGDVDSKLHFKDPTGANNRVVMTVDATGLVSAVTYSFTGA